MKKYPRIYNLCTIGIIHHQEFEYKFHPFRTDFIGDSGTGKSIIADLLQLIIVGGVHYKSSTDGNDDRPVNGLVLSSGQNSDFGYAFMNVEVAESSFITIGVYVESTNTNVRSFIIQNSIDFNKDSTTEKVILASLNKPTTIDQFEVGDKWQPIDVLQDLFHEKYQIGFKHWLRLKDFHKILFDNRILSVDLSRDTGTLVNYAMILRAFSRKNIDLKKNDSLKEFLFGNEKSTIFLERFKVTAIEMKETVDSYQKNLSEIAEIEKRKEGLDILYGLKAEKDQTELMWAKSFWNSEKHDQENLLKQLRDLVVQFNSSVLDIKVLEELKMNKKDSLRNVLPEQSVIDRCSNEFLLWKKRKESSERIKTELSEGSLELEELVHEYELYRKNKNLINAYQKLNQELETEDLFDNFEKIEWSKGYSEGIKELEMTINELDKEMGEKVSLQKFTDINNVNSLGYWAINMAEGLTKTEESIILHFQNYETLKPRTTQKANYIPDPREIIDALDERIQHEENGFWLNLGGIHEFIEITSTPFLSVLSKAEIKNHFETWGEQLSDRIAALEKELVCLKKLKEILIARSYSVNAVKAFVSKSNNQLEVNNRSAVYELSEDDFSTCIADYKMIDEILENYGIAKKAFDEVLEMKTVIKQLIQNLEAHESYSAMEKNILDEIGAIASKYEIELTQSEGTNFKFESADYVDYFEEFRKVYDLTLAHLKSVNEIMRIDSRLDEVSLNIQKHEIEFPDVDFKLLSKQHFEEPNSLKTKFENAKSNYLVEYKTLVNSHVLNDKEYFLNNESFEELSKALLPEILKDVDFNDSDTSQLVLDYLNQINIKNRELNQSKLVKIRLLLDELYNELDNQLNAIRSLRNFFNRKEAKITGNHKASIEDVLKPEYPISWIPEFKQELTESGDGIFKVAGGLIDKMESLPTLEEKIIHAFKEYSGTGYRHAELKDILNPYSYYSLTYRIENSKGKRNSGSTGQSYAALALLCIAKLSLINDNFSSDSPGLRFMAIDEVAGIGTNFDMLKTIAKDYDYQIISQSIETVRPIKGQHNIFNLYKDNNTDAPINRHPQAVISI